MAEKINPESTMFFNKERIVYQNSIVELISKHRVLKPAMDISIKSLFTFLNKEENTNGN